jgi:hypothetical protein
MPNPHEVFVTLSPFPLPKEAKALKTFLENITALKSSEKRYESHIDRWFNLAGMTEPDRDVKLARQVATFHALARNVGIFATKRIVGTFEDGNPEQTQRIQKALKDTFLDCANRCGAEIHDRERTFCYLALRDTNMEMPEILKEISNAAQIEYNIFKSIGRDTDGCDRFNWSNVCACTTNHQITNLLIRWFVKDPAPVIQTKMAQILKPATKKTPKVKKTLNDALDDLALKTPTTPTNTFSSAYFQTGTQINPASAMENAFKDLAAYYNQILDANGLKTPIVINAGVIRFDGNFHYQNCVNLVNPDEMTPTQLTDFEKHLESFDKAFQNYLAENSRAQAHNRIAQSIRTFLATRPAQNP